MPIGSQQRVPPLALFICSMLRCELNPSISVTERKQDKQPQQVKHAGRVGEQAVLLVIGMPSCRWHDQRAIHGDSATRFGIAHWSWGNNYATVLEECAHWRPPPRTAHARTAGGSGRPLHRCSPKTHPEGSTRKTLGDKHAAARCAHAMPAMPC